MPLQVVLESYLSPLAGGLLSLSPLCCAGSSGGLALRAAAPKVTIRECALGHACMAACSVLCCMREGRSEGADLHGDCDPRVAMRQARCARCMQQGGA